MAISRRLFLGASLAAFSGCTKRESRVVLYCAQDQEFAEGILADFTQSTGLAIAPKYDTEAQKSVGLATELEQEADHPRCDVHWNNEILATILLARKGVYQPYLSPAAEPYPAWTKSPDQTWQAFAQRVRVLIVNTKMLPQSSDYPRSLLDLTNPKWSGRLAMAKPTFGTTATFAACLFDAIDPDAAKAFFRGLKANNIAIVAGNKQVATGVGEGKFAAGLTDSDDALSEVQEGRPVALVYLDRDTNTAQPKLGTLFIPNTLAVIKNCPNAEGARKLVDYLLRPETEERLATGGGFQIPLNPQVKAKLPAGLMTPSQVKPMDVDFNKAADRWSESQAFMREVFGV